MSAGVPVISERLGPRGRQRVLVATVIGLSLIAAFLVWLVWQLGREGQLEGRLWSQFVDFEEGWPRFLFVEGLLGTLQAAVGAMIASAALGLLLALGRISKAAPLRWACGFVIDVFRGPPVLLFIFFSFYALPQVLPGALGSAVGRNPLLALVIGLTAYHMAVLAEVFRAGILSLDRGQGEAAKAVGMTDGQTMRIVILPQALRRMIPTIVAQLATITKDTSLGFIIGLSGDLMGRGRAVVQGPPINDLQTWFVVGMVYFVLIWALARLARRLEVQQRRKLGARKIEVGGGMEDLEAIAEDAELAEATPVQDA